MLPTLARGKLILEAIRLLFHPEVPSSQLFDSRVFGWRWEAKFLAVVVPLCGMVGCHNSGFHPGNNGGGERHEMRGDANLTEVAGPGSTVDVTNVDLHIPDRMNSPDLEASSMVEEDIGCASLDCEEHSTGSMPQTLTVVWSNIADADMVTVGKLLVLEFEVGTPMPDDSQTSAAYDSVFPAFLVELDSSSGGEGEGVPLDVRWRSSLPGLRPRPSLVARPTSGIEGPLGAGLKPTTTYQLKFWLGEHWFIRTFRTLPTWHSDYKKVTLEVPVHEDCEGWCGGDCNHCFPYPVTVDILIPPEYYDNGGPFDNSSGPWENAHQSYPVLVVLTGAQTADAPPDYALTMIGWQELPRFSSFGVFEPSLIVVPHEALPAWACVTEDTPFWYEFSLLFGSSCHSSYIGLWDDAAGGYSNRCFSSFLAHTLRRYVASRFRVRGFHEDGNVADLLAARRAYGIAGLFEGGLRALVGAFSFPHAYGGVYALMPVRPSVFNPRTYWYEAQEPSFELICNQQGNETYPLENCGGGFRDLSMLNPETGLFWDTTLAEREILPGSHTCDGLAAPAVDNSTVLDSLCLFDPSCMTDPAEPNEWKAQLEAYPFHGNIFLVAGLHDDSGSAGAMDLDHQLDKRAVPHSFLYEDRTGCGTRRDEAALAAHVHGTWSLGPDGDLNEGCYPGGPTLFRFFNNAFEGVGNRPFNHPSTSEFTTGALDPDRDMHIDLTYEPNSDLSFVTDNCPSVYNPAQEDADGDGIGDKCDGDG